MELRNYELTEHSFAGYTERGYAGITDPGIHGITECSCIAAEIRIYGKTELRKAHRADNRIN